MVISRTLTIFVCVDFHLNRERERVHLHTYFPLSLSSPTFCVFYLFVFILFPFCFHFVSLSRDWKSHTCCFFLFLSFLSLERLEGSRGLGGGKEEKGRVFRSFFLQRFWGKFCVETRILLSKSWIVFVLFDGFSARVFFFFRSWCMGFFFSWVVVF